MLMRDQPPFPPRGERSFWRKCGYNTTYYPVKCIGYLLSGAVLLLGGAIYGTVALGKYLVYATKESVSGQIDGLNDVINQGVPGIPQIRDQLAIDALQPMALINPIVGANIEEAEKKDKKTPGKPSRKKK